MFPTLTVALCAFASLLSPPVAGPRADFESTDALLREITAAALPEVRKETGVEFPDGVRVLLATTEEIEEALLVEARPQMALQFEDEKIIELQAAAFAANLARAIMAKFRFEDRAVLVSADGFDTLAELLSMPDLASEARLRGVILHELVHAADEERYGISSRFSSFATTDALQAFNCIVEGHAQLVARRIAQRLGWMEGFLLYTKAIGALPDEDELQEMGPAMEMFLRLQVATFTAAYYQGEAFLRTIEEEAGPAAVARAFQNPPSETAIIFEPAWFLHPERRPKMSFDFTSSLDGIAADFPEPEWASVRLSPTPPQLDIALRLLRPETVMRVKRSLVQSLMLTSTELESAGQTAVIVGLLEFRSPSDAPFYLEAYRRLQRRNDEEMKEGVIKITSSTYEEVEDPPGLACRKTVEVAGTEMELRALCLVRGRLVTELVLTETGLGPAAVRALALRALDGSVLRAPAEEGPTGDGEEPGENEDEG